LRDFRGRVIGLSLFVDQQKDVSIVLLEGVPTFEEVTELFDSGRYGLTAKAAWDFRNCSLSTFDRSLLHEVAARSRALGLKNGGLPLAIAMVAGREEDLVLLRLYNEVSLHGAKRLRPHRIFQCMSDAINWLDFAVGDGGPDGGMSGMI